MQECASKCLTSSSYFIKNIEGLIKRNRKKYRRKSISLKLPKEKGHEEKRKKHKGHSQRVKTSSPDVPKGRVSTGSVPVPAPKQTLLTRPIYNGDARVGFMGRGPRRSHSAEASFESHSPSSGIYYSLFIMFNTY